MVLLILTEPWGAPSCVNSVEKRSGMHPSSPGVRSAGEGLTGSEVQRRRVLTENVIQGTGLFLGVGGALASGGPLGVLLGYSIMGAVVWSMMVALGEMTTAYPVTGALTHLCV